MSITVRYLGHSCFTLTSNGYTVALDPFDPSVPGYPALALSAHKTLCSHAHHDHNYLDAVVMPLNEIPNPFEIEVIHCFHDEKCGALRGENKIHIISAGNLRIAHLGDLGHLLSDELVREIGRLDLLLIPVGGTYTIDPRQANELANMLCAKIVVPMHYRRGKAGYENISDLDGFLLLRSDVRFLDESSFVLTETAPSCTLVMEHAV